MTKTFTPGPEAFSDKPSSPDTLGTLAASLVTCVHAEVSRVRFAVDVSVDARPRVWCGACGAVRTGESPMGPWQSPTGTSRLTKRHFEDVVLLLHGIRQLTLVARAHVASGAPGSPEHVFFRTVRSSLWELSRLAVVREIDQLERAIAEMPSTLPPP